MDRPTPNEPILDDRSRLTEAAATEILGLSSKLACECPRHLLQILASVREFIAYERSCAAATPKDREIHEWLEGAGLNIDQMLSATISQLARIEGMVDDDNRIVALGTANRY